MAGKPVISQSTGWLDVYALTGFAVGSALMIQNQAGNIAVIEPSLNSPADTDRNGYWIEPGEEGEVEAGFPGCWVRTNQGTRLYVQEA